MEEQKTLSVPNETAPVAISDQTKQGMTELAKLESKYIVGSFSIVTEDDLVVANADKKEISRIKKVLNEERLSATRPLDATITRIIAWFKPVVSKCEAIEAAIIKEGKRYSDEQEAMRRAEEARLQEAARKEEERQRKELEAQAKKKAEEGNIQEAQEIKEAAAQVRVDAPVVEAPKPKIDMRSFGKKIKFRIDNENLIPREYLIPDEVAIGKVVRALGMKASIQGVKVWEE